RFGNRGAIGHSDLPLDSQAQAEETLGEKIEVGVGRLAEQQFCSCVDDLDPHEVSLAQDRASVIPCLFENEGQKFGIVLRFDNELIEARKSRAVAGLKRFT